MISVDFKTLSRILPVVLRANKPVMLRGPMGIGKSELVYQLSPVLAKIMNLEDKEYKYPVIERRASQMSDVGDMIGMPFTNGETTSFHPMAWFYQATQVPCILFFDELDRANVEIRQAIFEISDSRKLFGHKLHPATVIISCVNSGAGDDYQVGDMDPAELNRWRVFDVAPSVDDWLRYAKESGVSDQIVAFIASNPVHLENQTKNFETNKVYPSRRSWFRVDQTLKNIDSFKEQRDVCSLVEEDVLKGGNADLLYLTQCDVGHDAAVAFNDFCKNFESALKPEDIFDKGLWKKTEKFEINKHYALLQQIMVSNYAKEKLTKDQALNFVKYFYVIPPELVISNFEEFIKINPLNAETIFEAEAEQRKGKTKKVVQFGKYLLSCYQTRDEEKEKK